MVDFIKHIQRLKDMEAYEVAEYTQDGSDFLQDYYLLSYTDKNHYLPLLVQEAPSVLSLLPAHVSNDLLPFVTDEDEQKNIYVSWILQDIHWFDKIPGKVLANYPDVFGRLLSSSGQLKSHDNAKEYLKHRCQHQSFKELFTNNWWEDNPNLYYVLSEKDGLPFFVYRMRYEGNVDIPDAIFQEVLNNMREISTYLMTKWMRQYCDNVYRNLDRYVMSHTITDNDASVCQLLAFLKKKEGNINEQKISNLDKWIVYNTLQKDPFWEFILPKEAPSELDAWFTSILNSMEQPPIIESELHF